MASTCSSDGGTPGDDLLQPELHRLDVVEVAVHLTRTAPGRRTVWVVCIWSGATTTASTRTPGTCTAWVGSWVVGQPLDLGDHDAAVVVRGVGLVEGAESAALLLVGQVAVRVGGGGADDRDVDLDRGIEEVLAAADLHQLHEVVGDGVHLRALEPRVGVGAEADLGEHAGLAGRRGPMHLEQHPGRDVVGPGSGRRGCSCRISGGSSLEPPEG